MGLRRELQSARTAAAGPGRAAGRVAARAGSPPGGSGAVSGKGEQGLLAKNSLRDGEGEVRRNEDAEGESGWKSRQGGVRGTWEQR